MCLPDYIYGLILIDSLGDNAAQAAARSADDVARRTSRVTYRPRRKIFPTDHADADNVVPAGA